MSSAVPEGWRLKTIGDLVKLQYGKSPKDVMLEDGQYPVIGTGGVTGYASSYLFDGCTTVIGRKGTINKPSYVEGKFWAIDTTYFGADYKDAEPKWFYYSLNSFDLTKYNEASGVPSLGRDTLNAIPLSVPPLPEQQKIAAILSSVDDVIEKTRAQIDKLKDLKTGMMQGLLTKGIGHTAFKDSPVGLIPEGWEVVDLKFFCKLQNGYAFKSEEFQEIGTPLIRISNIKNNYVSIDSDVCINAADVADRFVVRKGDTLIAMSGATTGKTGTYQLNMPAFLNQRVGKFVADSHKADKGWVKHLVQTQWFSEAILLDAIAGAQPPLIRSHIESIICPFPPIR